MLFIQPNLDNKAILERKYNIIFKWSIITNQY